MDLTNLDPETAQVLARLLEEYKSGNLTVDKSKRSPMSGPLKDLRDPGTPEGRLHRPSFFFQTTPSYTVPTEYPKVKWHQNGSDTIVTSRQAEDALGDGWGDLPNGKAETPAERAKAEMMKLSPEDQELVRNHMRETRLRKIQEAVGEMSPAEIDALMSDTKRGPGRPRKADGDRS